MLAGPYASGFLLGVWVPDEATLGLRRQVTRRTQIVRQRMRLKTIVQWIPHAHLVPPCTHGDLFRPRGRTRLLTQPLPLDEKDATTWHMRECDRVSGYLIVAERELAREAQASANVIELMTIPAIDMVVAVDLIAAMGPTARFAGPARLAAYLGLNPSAHRSGFGKPRHGRIIKQGRCHAPTMLVEAAWPAGWGSGPLRAFFQRDSARRGLHIAAVAVAPKLAVTI